MSEHRAYVGLLEVALDALGDHEQDFRGLPQNLGEPQVADALLPEVGGGEQLDALHLAELRLVAQQRDEYQFHDAAVPLLARTTFALPRPPALP